MADTDSWEQKLAQALKEMPEVIRYVKNHNLSCLDDDRGPDDLFDLLIEVTGEKKKDKAAKVSTARTLWVPSINNDGSFGRWAFIEVADPWNAQSLIRQVLRRLCNP